MQSKIESTRINRVFDKFSVHNYFDFGSLEVHFHLSIDCSGFEAFFPKTENLNDCVPVGREVSKFFFIPFF